jgi:hypothetical protein
MGASVLRRSTEGYELCCRWLPATHASLPAPVLRLDVFTIDGRLTSADSSSSSSSSSAEPPTEALTAQLAARLP